MAIQTLDPPVVRLDQVTLGVLIEAHLTIVCTALAVSRAVQTRTSLAIRNVIRQLRPLRSATIAINGATQTFAAAIPAEQQAVIESIREPGDLTH